MFQNIISSNIIFISQMGKSRTESTQTFTRRRLSTWFFLSHISQFLDNTLVFRIIEQIVTKDCIIYLLSRVLNFFIFFFISSKWILIKLFIPFLILIIFNWCHFFFIKWMYSLRFIDFLTTCTKSPEETLEETFKASLCCFFKNHADYNP